MSFLRDLHFEFMILVWGWRAYWRLLMGRWFVCRDIPDNYLAALIVCWYSLNEQKKADNETKELLRQGIEEFDRRISQIRREMEDLLRIPAGELRIPAAEASRPTPASEGRTDAP
jgi:hypothetical protein